MFDSPVDEIKSRLDVAEVIGSYIRLQKSGRNFKANCPFHHEKTPSFMVSPEKQIWHCFGCSEGGDIFSFVMKIDGVEFGDALKTLAQRAGVVLKRQDPQLNTQRHRFYEICELATKFFERQLWDSKSGQKMVDYLIGRELTRETIKNWRLGYAPNSWDELGNFLLNRGYNQKEIFDAGLISAKDGVAAKSWRFCDRFRDRIMFPVADINNQIVGFSGRINPSVDNKELAKYINTSQTIIYDKSRLLFGLNKAKTELRQQDACIVVEGNMDVIMSHQAGVRHTVASSGTALAEYQLKIIRRYTDNLLFAFDADVAGDTATKRAIELALQSDFNIKIIELSEKDPADLIKTNVAGWLKSIDEAKEIMEFHFNSAFKKITGGTLGVKEKKQVAQILLPIIKKIKNKIEQAHWLQVLSNKISIEEGVLREQMNSIALPTNQFLFQPASYNLSNKNNLDPLEVRLVSMAAAYPQKVNLQEVEINIFIDGQLRDLLIALKDGKKVTGPLSALKDLLVLQLEKSPIDQNDIPDEVSFCLNELRKKAKKIKLNDLQMQIKEAEKQGDGERLQNILQQFNNLSRDNI